MSSKEFLSYRRPVENSILIEEISDGSVEIASSTIFDASYAASTTDVIANIRELVTRLSVLERRASALNLSFQLPDAYEPLPLDTAERVREWGAALIQRFFALNAVVWLSKEPLDKATAKNEPIRELGKEMWRWYNLWKVNVRNPLEMTGKELLDPTFMVLFQEALARAKKKDRLAIRYMRDHWDMDRRGRFLQPMRMLVDASEVRVMPA